MTTSDNEEEKEAGNEQGARKRSAAHAHECAHESERDALEDARRALSVAHDPTAAGSELERAYRALAPSVDVHWASGDNTPLDELVFDVSAPFVAGEARWIVDFRPLQADHRAAHREIAHPSACAMHYGAIVDMPSGDKGLAAAPLLSSSSSSSFDTSEEPLELIGSWRTADNALQRDAFGDIERFPASFVSRRSRWRASATRCDRVRYSARFSLADLASCPDALGVVRGARGDEQTVLGALHVTLATPTNPTLVGAVLHFSLSTDAAGNALLLRSESPVVDKQRQAQPPPPYVELRSAAFAHTPAPLAHIELLSQSRDPFAIERVSLLAPDADADAAQTEPSAIVALQSRVPHSRIDGAYQVQRWQLGGPRSLRSGETLEIVFVRDKASGKAAGAWREGAVARLSASLDDMPALDAAKLDAAQAAVSQTVDSAPARSASGGVALRHGSRLCQLVNVAVPPDLAALVEIEIVGAALCPELSGAERSCADSPVAIDLLEQAATNATVSVPGPFGYTSAEICFTAHNEFFNPAGERGAAVPRQRFEAHAQLAARGTARRRALAAWMRTAEREAIDDTAHTAHTIDQIASGTVSPEHRSLDHREGLLLAARHRASGAVRDAYAHSELADSLRAARLERGLAEHEHVAHTFAVLGADAEPSELELAALGTPVSNASAWLALSIIGAACACTCVVYALASLRGGRSLFGATQRVPGSILASYFAARRQRH
jgi:hypothetical protein